MVYPPTCLLALPPRGPITVPDSTSCPHISLCTAPQVTSQSTALLMPLKTPHCLNRTRAFLLTLGLQLLFQLRMSLLFLITHIFLSYQPQLKPCSF